ncbi:TIGR03620 family F420-dependent LLM class oxidoreductase [Pseudonocardia sp. MH-G8]|uniref:TIGR03620 family F420-dependent LLM class oxidoreductase n=1 Tax=Pseudonocardia sp. MH-G8 TaxID=1854588 RepID=UPI000BA05297|nr:TIGR03620 family F420-dependent LLM class oxidoreductase [Pseudonocardia sp. MH-G8]OZM79386.1 LLM class F420-dependent oxidoreductase [Pseudonocardia sp. MH-G8]
MSGAPGRYGLALDVTDDLEAQAAAAEELGYSAIWVAGGQLASLEPLPRILRATTRIAVAPGIIPLDLHGPPEIAALYAEAERIAPGRLVVGIGGPQRLRTGALAAVEHALDELDAVAAAPRARRLLAALGPRKLDLARDRFGGAITLLVDPGYTRWARERLGEAPTLAVQQMVVLDEDPGAARAAARGPLGFLSTVGGYAAAFRRMGFDDREIRDLDDRLVDTVVAWGGADAVAARMRAQEAAGADHVVVSPVPTADGPGAFEIVERLAPALLTCA